MTHVITMDTVYGTFISLYRCLHQKKSHACTAKRWYRPPPTSEPVHQCASIGECMCVCALSQSMESEYPHVAAFDMRDACYGPTKNVDGSIQVELFKDGSNQLKSNMFNRINLCHDATNPMRPLWDVDAVRDDQSNVNKRGWAIIVEDSRTLKALEDLDETLVQAAIKRSKEWFKGKQLDESTIRDRHHPLVQTHEKDGAMFKYVKIKIKCGAAKYPTKVHLQQSPGGYQKAKGCVDDLTRNDMVVPVVSLNHPNTVWFMAGGSKFGISLQAEELFVTQGSDSSDAPRIHSSLPLHWSTSTNDQSPSVKRMNDDEDDENTSKKTKFPNDEEDEGTGAM